MTSIHDEINQSQQEQQISESDLITNIEETLFDNQINNQDDDENGLHVRNDDFFTCYCENCMRKQSRFLVDKFDNDMYTIHFIVRRTDEISRRRKFKHVKNTVGSNRSIYLFKECDSYLSS